MAGAAMRFHERKERQESRGPQEPAGEQAAKSQEAPAEALASSLLIGKPLREARIPKGIVIGGVMRDEQVIAARGDTVIEAGDTVVIFAARGKITQVEKLLSVRLDFF